MERTVNRSVVWSNAGTSIRDRPGILHQASLPPCCNLINTLNALILSPHYELSGTKAENETPGNLSDPPRPSNPPTIVIKRKEDEKKEQKYRTMSIVLQLIFFTDSQWVSVNHRARILLKLHSNPQCYNNFLNDLKVGNYNYNYLNHYLVTPSTPNCRCQNVLNNLGVGVTDVRAVSSLSCCGPDCSLPPS